MKKIFYSIIIFLLFFLITSIVYLATLGIETNRFNNLISNKIKNIDEKLKVNLNKIKIKLDIQNLSFFIFTQNPKLFYQNTSIQLREIRAYIDIEKILKKNNTPDRVFVSSESMKIEDLKKILIFTKPSNFKSFALNNIKSGELKISLDLDFDENFNLEDYQFDGYVKKIKGDYKKNIIFENLDFIFAVNKNLGSFREIKGLINEISINSGSLDYKSLENLEVNMNFESKLNLKNEELNQLLDKLNVNYPLKNNISLQGKSKHELNVILDKTLQILSYDYFLNLENSNFNLNFKDKLILPFFGESIKNITLNDTIIKLKLNSKNKNQFLAQGKYNINEKKIFNSFNISNNFTNKNSKIGAEVEISAPVNIEFLNYFKPKNDISKLNIDLLLKKKLIQIINLKYTDKKNIIDLSDFYFINGQVNRLGRIVVKTQDPKSNKINNDFTFSKRKKILIEGKHFDARSLLKAFNKSKKRDDNILKKISNKVEINLEKIKTQNTGELSKFKLIGELKNGKFEKIISKGEFKKGGFLDISLKKGQDSENKFLEVYSDFSEPLLNDYSFFKGLEGGTLFFKSVFNDNESQSNLTIENFKVKNAPNFVKLLALADFGGLEDLVSGSGLSFDKLDINFKKEKKILKLEELYAIGPSISILMEGYVDENTKITSLRGTMVPAKNLNKLLSKIPVVGKIIIPDEIGEGLFGVSFKMKGPPGKIKTSVNPIKTLTPRFIQKALKKKTN